MIDARISGRLIGSAALLFLFPAAGYVTELRGAARALDGGTVEVAGQRVRVLGIHAPEDDQPCWLDGRPWRCGDNARGA